MLPPMIPKTQVLSQAVLHNGNCKRIQCGRERSRRWVASGALPHERDARPIDI
jgi:hypothetical protein